MEEIMDFVTENYLWFIIGGVVIIMAIIGYFADKKGFGKPKKKEVASEETTSEEKKVEEPVKTEESTTLAPVEPTIEVPTVNETVEDTAQVSPIEAPTTSDYVAPEFDSEISNPSNELPVSDTFTEIDNSFDMPNDSFKSVDAEPIMFDQTNNQPVSDIGALSEIGPFTPTTPVADNEVPDFIGSALNDDLDHAATTNMEVPYTNTDTSSDDGAATDEENIWKF